MIRHLTTKSRDYNKLRIMQKSSNIVRLDLIDKRRLKIFDGKLKFLLQRLFAIDILAILPGCHTHDTFKAPVEMALIDET